MTPGIGASAPTGRKLGRLPAYRERMRRRHTGPLALLLLAGIAGRMPAAAAPVPTCDPLTPVALVPSLVAFASSRGIPLEGIVVAAERSVPQKGDQVVVLLALENGGTIEQWLVRVEADDLTKKEQTMKPWPDDVIHTSTGLHLHYPKTPTALLVELTGPFSVGSTQQPDAPTQARSLVSREYLDLGIAQFCRSALQIVPRLEAATITDFHYSGSTSIPSAEIVARDKQAAAAFGLTPEEERLFFSVYFSLQTFFSAAMAIPGNQHVLEQVIQKPSVWSVVTHFGVRTSLSFNWQDVKVAPDGKAAVQQPVYLLPVRLSLNSTLAVRANLAVSEPRPPLQTSAGILAICAEHPTVVDRRLFIRVLSARRAATPGS
jgi:hypothetical protein